jgi:hypothetical protein
VDHRLVKVSPPKERCAALNLCPACIKYAAVPCGLQRLFALMIPAVMALALMPLTASVKLVTYNTRILDHVFHYSHPVDYQLFEIRYCPLLALALLAASWLVLVFKRQNPVPLAKVLFAAGLGPLSFGLVRQFIFRAYSDHLLWFVFWEELTEFLFVASVAMVLWVFRKRLFEKFEKAA